jgi:DNA/RNA endonuclease YhcR with UshA esterase domain
MNAKALLISAALIVCCCSSAPAQDGKTNASTQIPASLARQHVGEEIVVRGKIAEVNLTDKLVRLNFDKPFPHHTFTAVIFAEKTNLFQQVTNLNGKLVEVQGKVTEFRGRPQMVLSKTNQLRTCESK